MYDCNRHARGLAIQIEWAALDWNSATIALAATTGKTMEITAADGQLALVGPRGEGPHSYEARGSNTIAVIAASDRSRATHSTTFSDLGRGTIS